MYAYKTRIRANIRLIRHTTTSHLPRCIYRTGLWPTVPEPGGRGETSREEKYLRTEVPEKPKISGVDSGEYNGLAGKETSADQSILTAISRLEAGLNELRSKQNARLSGHPQRRRGVIALKNRSSRRQKQPVGMRKRVDTLLATVIRATGTADLLILSSAGAAAG